VSIFDLDLRRRAESDLIKKTRSNRRDTLAIRLAQSVLRPEAMNSLALLDAPPTDFVTFLAQRGGLSPEAAARRLEHWLGEYQTVMPAGSRPREQAGDESLCGFGSRQRA